ncbi:MAG TPA: hypothetical protein VHG28_05445, partial [Longimicrobiaceae bacterium]|nr:hypothetical protein [Longimicrobiaceae bacterium]
MTLTLPFQFKIASEPSEFEQIHRLNYRTFVDEIPQHEPNGDRVLVDRFDGENTYVVCLRGDALLGMISVRGRRPFSLDHKLRDLDAHLPPGRTPCEIRLLSVDPEHRTGVVFRGLVECLARHCLGEGYDLALISGTVRQLRLYRHIGFIPFGPLVGTGEALYQPMYLTLESFRERGRAFERRPPESAPVSFLPGPVEIAPEVRRAMAAPPVSHRGGAFVDDLARTRSALAALTGARRVQVMLGSGTLANEAVAAQLSLLGEPGLVLSHGEFGERLADHAARWGLAFAVVRQEWGSVFTRRAVEAALDAHPGARWLWAVHCETSSGVLTDLEMLREACAARGVRLCVDCISSLGTVPVELEGVYLATGVSGKGIGSFPGIALVFHHHEIVPSDRLPRYLDLGLYAACDGTPFTQSSNLVRALDAAVARLADSGIAAEAAEDSAWLRDRLRERGFRVLAAGTDSSPAVT